MPQYLNIVSEEIHVGIMCEGPLDLLYLLNIRPVNSDPSAQSAFSSFSNFYEQ